ncbi:hypothetical protein BGZ83_009267 [Gryganskiella cystojenkinii]|nr:hypothetical protein BGZ83_009267 [Gryganskiella cystojenkinii]
MNGTQDNTKAENTKAYDLHWDGEGDYDPVDLIYSLEIVQQPQRARMCGFGDKDRRHITPAPVLRLVARTEDGIVIPASRLNKQTFVVNADLWLEDEATERNLVLVSSIASSNFTSAPAVTTLPHSNDSLSPERTLYDRSDTRTAARIVMADDGSFHEEVQTTLNLVGQTTVGGQTAPGLEYDTSYVWFAFSALSIRTEENNEIANHLNKYSIRIPSRKDEKPRGDGIGVGDIMAGVTAGGG